MYLLGDIWACNLTSNSWAFLYGPKAYDTRGVYGIRGVEETTNAPGSRFNHGAVYNSVDRCMYIFGGFGRSEASKGLLNDGWKFNLASLSWTWVAGNSTIDVLGRYGTKYESHFSRIIHMVLECSSRRPILLVHGKILAWLTWRILTASLYLVDWVMVQRLPRVGIQRVVKLIFDEIGLLNDLWMFNCTSNQWTWISGSNVILQPSVYGINGVSSSSNQPSSRSKTAMVYDSRSNRLYLFGGSGYANTTSSSGLFGHLILTSTSGHL